LVKVPEKANSSFLDISHLLSNSVCDKEEMSKTLKESLLQEKKADQVEAVS
jgi:hypothetical protein